MLSIVRAAPLLPILFATPTFAATDDASRIGGGIIHFSGQVVETPCETTSDLKRQQMEMRCWRDGVESVESWPLASLTGPGARSSLAAMDIRYLDPQRKLAILTINYQ